jgi:hypothetical protein
MKMTALSRKKYRFWLEMKLLSPDWAPKFAFRTGGKNIGKFAKIMLAMAFWGW